MVRLVALLLLPIALWAESSLAVTVHSERVSEFAPIDVVASITCSGNATVDPSSFELQGEKINARFSHQSVKNSLFIINNERKESRIVTYHYTFQLPGRPAGRHLLPALSVEVDGKRLSAPTTSYVVYGATSSPDFRLEAIVEGADPLYPGQRCTLVYKLSFADPIDPTYKHLPLFESPIFRKLGEPKVVYDYRGGLTIQEIRQEVQAVTAGEHHFEPAVIEGFPYAKDFFGNRLYEERRMRAETDAMDLTVLPFPQEGRAGHFDGAVGNLSIKASLVTSSEAQVGDKMRVRVDLVGKGEWPTIHPPNLSEQPAFADNFRLGDLPPAGQEGVGRKSFTIELRPLSSDVTEIPPIEYAVFDPKIEGYRMVRSQPIPIHVIDSPALELGADDEIAIAPHEEESPWAPPDLPVHPVDGSKLEGRAVTGWLWFAFPLVAFVLAVQGLGSRALQRRKPTSKTARQLVREVHNAGDLEQAILRYLEERGWSVEVPEQLSDEGEQGKARLLWERANELRYSGGDGAVEPLVADLKELVEERR